MTLTRQLWIVIAVLITLTFISSFIVSGYSARNYFLEQLTVKNIDNVTSLALSLSQVEKDPVTVELMIAAQFDAGHYTRIELVDPNGQTLVRRLHPELEAEVPDWFARLMAFDVPPGVAQVQDGWMQFGTLTLESQTAYALNALWRVFYQLLAWILAIAILVGVIGSFLLRRISQPLQAVVEQAEALGERRFITSREPRTLEFMRLVRAMNTLTNRVRAMLESEARRLDEIRRQSQLDAVTGVANREQFFRVLDARLSLPDQSVQDSLVLLRVTGLAGLNARLGRAATDEWLRGLLARFRSVLAASPDAYGNFTMGRLNGSDFTILLTNTDFLQTLTEDLWQAAQGLLEEQALEAENPLALVACYFRPGEQRGALLARIDDLLTVAEQEQTARLQIAGEQRQAPLFADAGSWYQALQTAIAHRDISHACYPVVSVQGELIHEEAMLRIRLLGQQVSAGGVIGWARRLGLLPQLDLQVLESVLQVLADDPERKMAVNVSVESLRNSASFVAMIQRIERCSDSVQQALSLEFNEQVAVQHPGLLASFSAAVKSHGVTVGLQSAGRNIPAIPGLERLGLDYMKVDAALIQHQDEAVRNLLRGLCKLGRSLGLTMIAEGVLPDTDRSSLAEIGFDGFTGPGVDTV